VQISCLLGLLTNAELGRRQPHRSEASRSVGVLRRGELFDLWYVSLLGLKLLGIQLPDEARMLAVHQLETLSGVAKGLTRSTEGLLLFSEDDHEAPAKMEEMTRARAEERVVKLRSTIELAMRGIVEMWSNDAAVGLVSGSSSLSFVWSLTATLS